MSAFRRVKAALRPYRRPLFEALGSDRYSHLSNDNLDRKLAKHLTWTGGTFIEAGANDGLSANNTYWFERFRGWRGILVEPSPLVAAQCERNRPKAKIFNCALVASEETKSVPFSAAGLMGYITGNFAAIGNPDHEAVHRQQACDYQGLDEILDIQVPGRTISSLIDEAGMTKIDLLSLDVEGYELQVLQGLDVERHRPRFLCIETHGPDVICAALGGHYETVEQLAKSDWLLRAKH